MISTSSQPLSRFGVAASTLRTLAAALRSGQLTPPLSGFAVGQIAVCPPEFVAELAGLAEQGMAPRHIALLLDAVAETVEGRIGADRTAELVWTGPEGVVSTSRDTAVVVDELFSIARSTVLISTFVIHQPERVFAVLGKRLDEEPDLHARLFVHVPRDWKDERLESELLREFADEFRNNWPGTRLPEVFYDPRTLSSDSNVRATWHAKCLLVDDEITFVTSANFTEWAQQRNVEAGALIRSCHFARQLRSQFDGLIQARAVRRVPGI